MSDERLAKIRNYLSVELLAYWKSSAVPGGNISEEDVHQALEINTLEGYKKLVDILKGDYNEEEAKKLLELIKEIETN